MKRLPRCASINNCRNGSTTTLFAVLMFAILPLMSLIVHVGLVTLTRRQMQTAVNTSALEGLRFRDDEPVTESIRDNERRLKAAMLVETLLDDDLNPGDGQGNLQLGVGPEVTFEDGIQLPGTDFRASARIATPRPFRPAPLEPNPGNELNGDMVAGHYLANDSNHVEDTNSARTDFNLNGKDAFLVRMRRSGETFPQGVGSAGPPIPYLFGRGPFGNAEWRNRIERGTIVRATAIAQAQPALRVGLRNEDLGLVGLLNLQMDIDRWIAEGPVSIGSDPENEAQRIDTQDANWGPITVGDFPKAHTISPLAIPSEGYVILTGEVEDAAGDLVRRIVGFGYAKSVSESNGEVRFERLDPQPIASENASSTLGPAPPGWQDLNLDSLFNRIHGADTNPYLIKAPVLRRSIR